MGSDGQLSDDTYVWKGLLRVLGGEWTVGRKTRAEARRPGRGQLASSR